MENKMLQPRLKLQLSRASPPVAMKYPRHKELPRMRERTRQITSGSSLLTFPSAVEEKVSVALGPGESAEAGDPLPGWEEDAAARAFLRCGKLKAAATLPSYESPKHSMSS